MVMGKHAFARCAGAGGGTVLMSREPLRKRARRTEVGLDAFEDGWRDPHEGRDGTTIQTRQ